VTDGPDTLGFKTEVKNELVADKTSFIGCPSANTNTKPDALFIYTLYECGRPSSQLNGA
jgi:hypothetical protein